MYIENESTLVRAHLPCSRCSSHDACAEYTDHFHCFSCGQTWKKDGGATVITEERKYIKMEEIIEGKIREIADRCISEETAKKFGVRTLVKEHKIARHIYPYYGKTGEKVAEKIRECATKEFFWRGDSSSIHLFGAQCQPTTGRFVVVTEGEVDCMSMWQALGGRYTVVSLPNGCKNFKALKDSYQYLDKFESIILCLDGDKAGRDAVERAIQYLPQKKLRIMKLPEDRKDPNEFLKAGKTQDLLNYFWRAEEYRPADIVNIGDMYDRLSEYRKTHEYISTPWVGLNDMIQGTRPGQLVILAAGTGMGKSAFLKSWMYHLVRSTDLHIGALYLEENPEETVLSLMSVVAGKNLKKNSVWDTTTEEDKRRYFDECGANRRIELFEPISSTDPEYICNKIRYMVIVRDCKYIILDHITYVTEAEEDAHGSLNRLMKSLHSLCVELGVVILAACHLRKSQDAKHTSEEGGRVTLDDFKNSSSIKQLSDICIGLERNSQDEDPVKANTTIMRVLKNRDFGTKGPCTALFYDKDTTRLQEVGLESQEDNIGGLLDESTSSM